MKIRFLFFLIFVSTSLQSGALNNCLDAFSESNQPAHTKIWTKPDYEIYKNELATDQLKKMGFEVSTDSNLVDLNFVDSNGQKKPQIVGRLMTRNPSKLFHWGTQEDHQDMITNGGISKIKMQQIHSNSRGADAGNGYYVSLHPFDSSNYGPVVTVFSPEKPMVILELPDISTYDPNLAQILALRKYYLYNNAQLDRLSSAGIDGLRKAGYTENWLSIISERPLSHAENMTPEVLQSISNEVVRMSVQDLEKKYSFVGSGLLWYLSNHTVLAEQLPKNNPFREFILNQKLSDKDVVVLAKAADFRLPPQQKTSLENYITATLGHTSNPTDFFILLRGLEALGHKFSGDGIRDSWYALAGPNRDGKDFQDLCLKIYNEYRPLYPSSNP